MTDTRAHDLIERIAPARALFLKLRNAGWSERLVLFLRVMAVVSMLKGLYHWAAVCGFIGEAGGFEAHVQSWQATTVFFSVIDLVAAVGLWLVAPWGAVVWLTSAVSTAVIDVFFHQVFGPQNLVVGLEAAAIASYLFLAIQAAREHPQ
jgi:Family of unknown function (DUF6163)